MKRIVLLLAGLLLLLACSVPSAAITLTATPVTEPTSTPEMIPATETVSAPVTDTPAPASPPLGTPISHLPAGQALKLTLIHMLDESQGWAIASDHILRTTDGALTWKDITPPEPASSEPKNAIGFFMDSQTAWVAFTAGVLLADQTATIWRTFDGGTSWQYSALTEPALHQDGYSPANLSFVDPQHGWMLVHVGAGMNHDYFVLLATANGGETWQTLISPQQDSSDTQVCYKNALTFVSPQDGWMTVDCHGVIAIPYIYKSHDGGKSWQTVQLPAPPSLPDIFNQGYCAPSDPILFGPTAGDLLFNCVQDVNNVSTPISFFYETTNDGASWNSYPYPGGTLQFVNASSAFALSRKIQRSDDAGHTWVAVKSVNWDGQFSFINPKTAWVIATDNGQSALVKTTDGGLTWQEIKPKVAP